MNEQNKNSRFETLKHVILGLSDSENYAEFQNLCNEAKFQMIIGAIEKAGSIRNASKSLGYASNASLFHTIDTRLGEKPENYQLETIEKSAKQSPPLPKHKELLENFTSLIHDKKSFDELQEASTRFLFMKKLKANDYKSQQTADDLGIAKSSLNRATKRLGIDTSKKNKFQSLDSSFFTEEHSDTINTLIKTSTFKTLKQAYKEAQKHHIHRAFISDNNKTMTDIVNNLGHDRAAITYNLENLFDIQYTSIEDTKEKIKNKNLNNSPEASLLTENSSDLKSLYELFINARSALIIDTLQRHDYVSAKAAKALDIDRSRMSVHVQAIEQNIELKKLSSQIAEGKEIAPKQTPQKQSHDKKKSTQQPSDFLTNQFSYQELKALKTETVKALIAENLIQNDFDIAKTAQDLEMKETQLVNGLKNFFKISITSETEPNDIKEKILPKTYSYGIHNSTVRDIIPQFSSYEDLSNTFADALKKSILDEWEANNKNSAITANNLGITDDAVIKVLPKVSLD